MSQRFIVNAVLRSSVYVNAVQLASPQPKECQQRSLPVGRRLSWGVSVACCIHEIAVPFPEAPGRGQSYVLEAAYRPGFAPCVLVGRP